MRITNDERECIKIAFLKMQGNIDLLKADLLTLKAKLGFNPDVSIILGAYDRVSSIEDEIDSLSWISERGGVSNSDHETPAPGAGGGQDA